VGNPPIPLYLENSRRWYATTIIQDRGEAGRSAGILQNLLPAAEVLSKIYGHSGYGFVPLVRDDQFLACSLRILCLRRDGPGALSATRDLDNRIKTLVDALTYVPVEKWKPLDDADTEPRPDEQPHFYVLLEDDRAVTHLEVETDHALAPNPADETDETFVRLVISVEIRPYVVTINNLDFS